jgi:hypothetical protein
MRFNYKENYNMILCTLYSIRRIFCNDNIKVIEMVSKKLC